ncbi:MAG: hypothetical protein H6590_02985 [Flavobacteriales bacterium]|nr:hypothetical protein [Flavobacteriales bacterium]HPF90199.1 hypothetical protein [Flavobacteriales bacterium]
MADLRLAFKELVERHGGTDDQAATLWSEVESAYSAPGRHYHDLSHIEDLHDQLQEYRDLLDDPDPVLLATVYHDLIIHVTRSDNEQRSADAMRRSLSVVAGMPQATVARASAHILGTKTHELSLDPDTNYFTDADLSILGSSRERYAKYAAQVRQEYGRFPDLLYKPGRRNVLRRFLGMANIFKTDRYSQRLELSAKENLQWELTVLVA